MQISKNEQEIKKLKEQLSEKSSKIDAFEDEKREYEKSNYV